MDSSETPISHTKTLVTFTEKFKEPWKNTDPDLTKVEDVKKRLENLKGE